MVKHKVGNPNYAYQKHIHTNPSSYLNPNSNSNTNPNPNSKGILCFQTDVMGHFSIKCNDTIF